MFRLFIQKVKAFSLIELLISLITISVILASLAPVITHKMKHGGISIGTKKLSMACPSNVGSDCTLCLGNQCIACPIGCGTQFKNTLTCKCESCTVANCANCASGANGCDKCKAGYQKSGNSCSACPSGQYSSEGGSCIKCAKGTKANSTSAATGCTTCDGNKEYQDLEGQTSCKTCSGFVHNNYRSCTSCSAGTYWSASSSTCQNCGAGTYSNSSNVTSCSSCPSGQYQPNSGQTSCLPCSGAVNDSKTACRSCSDFGANCIGCNYYACTNTSCESKSSCTSTQKYDGCHCVGCPSGQVANADKSDCYTPSTAPTSCKDGEYLANEKCNPCPAGCTKCSGETSCTECKNATDYKLVSGVCKPYSRPKSQEDCNKLSYNNSIYIPYDVDKYDKTTLSSTGGSYGFCMTKRNAGDLNGPKTDFGPAILQEFNAGDTNAYCTQAENRCCWAGHSGKSGAKNTAVSDKCSATPSSINKISSDSPFDYEACKRTVCNWFAADYICTNYNSGGSSKVGDWKLPSKESLDALKRAFNAGPTSKTDTNAKINIQKWSGNAGLQLCTHEEKANTAGSPRCDTRYQCYGAVSPGYSSACIPAEIWGEVSSGKVYYASMVFTQFSVSDYEAHITNSFIPYSVRCVLEKYIAD